MKQLKIVLFIIAPTYFLNAQIREPFHLSFNVKNNAYKTKRVQAQNGVIHFYIDDCHFIYDPKINSISTSTLQELNILKINDLPVFLKLAQAERQQKVEEGKKIGAIKILFNDEVFKKIYLYEKEPNNQIKIFEVTWVEEIE